MPEAVRCNLCGADDPKRLYSLRDYRLWVDEVEWDVVQCRRCGLGYLNPRPTPDEIGRYYPREYFDERAGLTERYRTQATYVQGPAGRLLDVGTARGDFLAEMRRLGWDVAGIEPAAQAGNPHRLPISRARFPAECDFPAESFDVVTAWSVFEHLYDPGEAFRVAARLLAPGGRLLLQVPNLRSIHSRLARLEDVPRHLYFFSERTLRAYGARAGLRLVRVEHAPQVFGGSGRGVLRLALVRALGRSNEQFFRIWRTPRRQRFGRWPLLTPAWVTLSAIERVVLADRIVRLTRLSGEILVEFDKPALAPAAAGRKEAA